MGQYALLNDPHRSGDGPAVAGAPLGICGPLGSRYNFGSLRRTGHAQPARTRSVRATLLRR